MSAEYQDLETKYKKGQFFKIRSAFMNSLNAHIESSPHMCIIINVMIIKTVVGELLFHPDDVYGVTRERALNLFKKLEEPIISDEVGQRDVYEVVIKTCCQFQLCIKFVSYGASFYMASCRMDCTKVESGMAVYGG